MGKRTCDLPACNIAPQIPMLSDSKAKCAAQGIGDEGISQEGSLKGGGDKEQDEKQKERKGLEEYKSRKY
jgi:hypothetical protein